MRRRPPPQPQPDPSSSSSDDEEIEATPFFKPKPRPSTKKAEAPARSAEERAARNDALNTPAEEEAARAFLAENAPWLVPGKVVKPPHLDENAPPTPPFTVPKPKLLVKGGVVGINSAKMAVGLGAKVTILDVSADRMRYLDDVFDGRLELVMSNSYNIAKAVKKADLLIGGVLIPGAKAPHLVTEDMVKNMKNGSVIVDVAIDQGGCIETIDRVTYHSDPVYEKFGVLHYSVGNMPGAVARTSTLALTNVTLPYAIDLANNGWKKACKEDHSLELGLNTHNGDITCKGVAEAFGYHFVAPEKVL